MASLNNLLSQRQDLNLKYIQAKTNNPEGLKARVLKNQLYRLDVEIDAQRLPVSIKTVPKKERIPANTKNQIMFIGKTYKIGKNEEFKSIVQLAKKLKVDLNDLKNYRDTNKTNRTFVNQNNETVSIDLRTKKPLILRDFGISRISNKQLLKESNEIKRQGEKIKIYSDLPEQKTMKIYIKVAVQIVFSQDVEYRVSGFPAEITSNQDIYGIIDEEIKRKYNETTSVIPFANIDNAKYINEIVPRDPRFSESPIIITRNNQGGQTMDIEYMQLRDEKPISIKNLYSNVIESDKWKHCIHDYMLELYNKVYSRKVLETLNNVDNIYKFCKDKHIKMIAYDINGNCIKANYPSENRSRRKNLFFIAYNNHLYPLKSQYLNKVNPIINNIKIIDDANKKIIELLENGRHPTSIKLDHDAIISFIDGDIKYIRNSEYMKCKEILTKFGLADKIFDSIRIMTLGKILSKLYITKSDNSVFIGHDKFVKGGFNYFNEELEGKFTTIDFNKFYPSCLKDLKFLIKVDMVIDDMCECNDNGEFDLDEDHYLYIAVPKYSTVLMPDTNCYSGQFLKYCKNEDIEFTIIEKIQTTRIDNHYKLMIEDLYNKLDNSDFKMVVNVLIGQFEKMPVNYNTKFIKIVNNDELKTVDEQLYTNRINSNYTVIYDVCQNVNIYSKKPIAIQIKDESRKRLYELMKKLKLTDANIKCIHTDSISYISDVELPKKYFGKGLGQIKYIDYKPINASFNFTDKMKSFICEDFRTNNILGNCYAGCGKTYKIINKYIPEFGNDYHILTPSHSSAKDYKHNRNISDVIQKFQFNNITPSENNIIIDEFGMVSRAGMHMILKWSYMGKRIIAYGDFKQLLPVGEEFPLNSSLFIFSVFNKFDEMTENRRNNFSKEFYDNIIQGKLNNMDVIKKYRSVNSNNYICYRNKTCDKYNQLISTKLGIRDKFAVGARIICNTNNLREMNIYNRQVFNIIEEMDNKVKLDNDLIIEKSVMNKIDNGNEYFTFAYARTLNSVQGESLLDFYFPDDDFHFVNSRFTYTLISRLKGNF